VGLILAAGPIAAGEPIGFERLVEKLLREARCPGARGPRPTSCATSLCASSFSSRSYMPTGLIGEEDAAAAAVGFGFEFVMTASSSIDFELMLVTLALGPRRRVGGKDPGRANSLRRRRWLDRLRPFVFERSTRPGRAQ
jgi:hypothetical protein